MKLIFEKSQAGRRAGTIPRHELPVPEVVVLDADEWPGDIPKTRHHRNNK